MSWTINFEQPNSGLLGEELRDGDVNSTDIPDLTLEFIARNSAGNRVDAPWEYITTNFFDGVSTDAHHFGIRSGGSEAPFTLSGIRFNQNDPDFEPFELKIEGISGAEVIKELTFLFNGAETFDAQDLVGLVGVDEVRFSRVDGQKLAFLVDDVVIDAYVPPVNNAPSGADKTITINEDAPRTLTAADFGFSDVDGHALVEVKFTTTPGNGSLIYDGQQIEDGDRVSV
ncbi:MAG: hypothetical protein ABW360_02145, partial [Phenylobacterium sp.]